MFHYYLLESVLEKIRVLAINKLNHPINPIASISKTV